MQSDTKDTQITDIEEESETKKIGEKLPTECTPMRQVASSESTTPRRKRRSYPRKKAPRTIPRKPSYLSIASTAGDGGDEEDKGESEEQRKKRKQQEHDNHRPSKSKERPVKIKS